MLIIISGGGHPCFPFRTNKFQLIGMLERVATDNNKHLYLRSFFIPLAREMKFNCSCYFNCLASAVEASARGFLRRTDVFCMM